MCKILLLLFVCSCHLGKPDTQTLAVRIVTPIPHDPVRCELAPLPDQVVIVGFPTDEKIYVSKSDLVNLMVYDAQIAKWARTLNDCMIKLGKE